MSNAELEAALERALTLAADLRRERDDLSVRLAQTEQALRFVRADLARVKDFIAADSPAADSADFTAKMDEQRRERWRLWELMLRHK